MNLTNEQIQAILAGAPEGVNTYGEKSKIYSSNFKYVHNLSDLRAILEKEKENQELRQQVQRLEGERGELMAKGIDKLLAKTGHAIHKGEDCFTVEQVMLLANQLRKENQNG